MKEMDPKNQKYSSEFLASQSLKKMIPQLLLSVSLFSFVFSYSSLYSSSSSLVYSPKFQYFSANYFQPLSHALNKNCLFLICNGLLVFLAKTSGFVRPPSGHDLNDMLQKRIGDSLDEKYHVLEESAAEPKEEEEEEKGKSTTDQRSKEVSIFIAESEEERGDCELEDVKKDENQPESRNCWLFDDDDDEQQLYGQEVVEEQQEEDEEEEEEEKEQKEEMSTEELNKKVEDFIRRMKEEIIINEARQKVVMVK